MSDITDAGLARDATYPARWRTGHVWVQVRCMGETPLGIVAVWMCGRPKGSFDDVCIDVTSFFSSTELEDFYDQFKCAPTIEWEEPDKCSTFYP